MRDQGYVMKINIFIGPGASTGLQFLHSHLAKMFRLEPVYEPIAFKIGTLPNLDQTHPFEPDETLFQHVKCFRSAPDKETLSTYLIGDEEYLFKIPEHLFESPQVKEYETLLLSYFQEIIRYYSKNPCLIGECRLHHNIPWLNYILQKQGFEPTFLFLSRDIIQILYLEYRHGGLTSNQKRRFKERYEISKRLYHNDPEFGFLFHRAKIFWDMAFVVIWIELEVFKRMTDLLSNAHTFSYESMVLQDTAYDTFGKLAEVMGVDVDGHVLRNYVDNHLIGTGKIETYQNDYIFHKKIKKIITRLFFDQKNHVLHTLPSLSNGKLSTQSFLYYISSVDPTGISFKFVRIMEDNASWSTLIPQKIRRIFGK